MSDERPDDRPDERAGERPRPAGLPILVVGRPDPVSTNGERVLAAGAPAISSDGRFVAFVSESGDLVPGDANGAADVFVRDTMLDRTVLIRAAPSPVGRRPAVRCSRRSRRTVGSSPSPPRPRT